MALGGRRTPERGNALFSGPVLQKGVTVQNVLTTGGGAETMTVAELLTGLLTVDCQDAQTWTTPTAALLNAGIPGVEVGTYFEFTVVNYGDALCTIALGTGVTNLAIDSEDAILLVDTHIGARFRLECTAVKTDSVPGSSDAWRIWALSTSTVTS